MTSMAWQERKTGKISWVSWQSLHSLWHGGLCREDQVDDNISSINEIKLNGPKLETVTSFKYLGSVLSKEGSKLEILSSIAQTTAALKRLKAVWNDRSMSLSSKIWLMHTPLLHSSSCMLVNHGPSQQSWKEKCEPWKWGANARYYATHTKTILSTRKSVPRASRQSDHKKMSWPSIVKRHKLKWYGHVSRS